MIEFHELKTRIISDLKKFMECQVPDTQKYLTFKTEINVNDLKALLRYLKEDTCFYFKSPKGSTLLALGDLQYFNNSIEFNEIEKHIKMNKDLYFVGALPFSMDNYQLEDWQEFKDRFFFLPRFLFKSEDNKTSLSINIKYEEINDKVPQMNLLLRVENLFKFIHREHRSQTPTSIMTDRDKKSWDSLINKGLAYLKEGSLKKVVLARRTTYIFDNSIDPSALFTECTSDKRLYEIFYKIEHGPAFISFTPEKLFHKKGRKIQVDSIAGTSANSEALLNSYKDIKEHRIVSDYIKSALNEFSHTVEEIFKEKILQLPKLCHLHSLYEATLDDDIGHWTILKTLHPTPAVGGLPKKEAVDFIHQNENFNRGFYAAPIGFISKDKSEFAVGIRSLLIKDNQIQYFGGAGIVNESNPISEWNETGNKIESIQCMIN